ncbi:MAG: ATP-binding protein [Zestosphaera sp.]
MGLFDLRPKSLRSELFDREEELDVLHRALERGYPLTVLMGIRRVGKTSLLKTFLNEVSGVYIDVRGVYRRSDLEFRVSDALNESSRRIKKFLEGIRGISVSGFSVEIKWRGRDSISFIGLLEELNKKKEKFVVALDEVQTARPRLSAEIRGALAYAYDNLENIVFIVAGSEMGMLRDFLKAGDPSSPLYGRHLHEVVVRRFTREESVEFLVRGFREEGVEPPEEVVEESVEFFDGVVGWLVLFGRRYVDGFRDLRSLKEMAIQLSREELEKLGPREKMALKAIASGCKSWSAVRDYVLEHSGVAMPKSTLSRIIDKLEKLSIIGSYEFLDPVYKEAATRLK